MPLAPQTPIRTGRSGLRAFINKALDSANFAVCAKDNFHRYHRSFGHKTGGAFFVIIQPDVIAKKMFRLRHTEQVDNFLLAHSGLQLPQRFFGQGRALPHFAFVSASAEDGGKKDKCYKARQNRLQFGVDGAF